MNHDITIIFITIVIIVLQFLPGRKGSFPRRQCQTVAGSRSVYKYRQRHDDDDDGNEKGVKNVDDCDGNDIVRCLFFFYKDET